MSLSVFLQGIPISLHFPLLLGGGHTQRIMKEFFPHISCELPESANDSLVVWGPVVWIPFGFPKMKGIVTNGVPRWRDPNHRDPNQQI